MSVATNKVRVYDLAKELKQDTKRIIEDARREGIDVSVPSNSVPKEVAEKIRNKYFPKKEVSAQRAVKIVKKVAKPEEHHEVAPTVETPVAPVVTAPVEKPQPLVAETPKVEEKPKVRQVIKLTPPKRIVAVEPTVAETPATTPQKEEPIVAQEIEKPAVVEPVMEETPVSTEPEPPIVEEKIELPEPIINKSPEKPVETVSVPTGPKIFTPTVKVRTQVRQLRLTKDALTAGFKPGEKVAAPVVKTTQAGPIAQTQTDKAGRENRSRYDKRGRERDRQDPRQPSQFRGTPGETATPQTTYIPPPSRKPQGRNKGGAKNERDKHGRNDRFQEKDFFVPKVLPLEVRLQQQLGVERNSERKTARLVEGATVREFAEKLGIAPRDVVQLLIKRGIFATVNQPLNTEIAKDLGWTFGYDVSFVPFEEMVVEQEFEDLIASETDDVEVERAPVVTVMGHVDHGKTSLLDAIRLTDVAAGEAGGITQHIGAYSVKVSNPDNPEEKRRVVFLDTPGHEAFTMMRARGAKATDVVILVVAADDGVMPQTIEAIEHAKAANVPIIVAINKIDKPDANPDRVKQELTGHGLQPVEWGGETEMVEVSAKKKLNLDTLLETVLLTADILELKASPTRLASGVVLEAKLDRGRGSVATVLVQQGTLRIGDPFIVGQYFGKVRAMFSDRGETVAEVPPATPVEVLGLQGVPQAGDTFQVVADIDRAQQISHQRQAQARLKSLVKTTARGLESLGQADFKELLVVLKADVQGSVEVLRATLEKLSTEKVKVKVIRSGVGAITESDVLLASATQAGNSQTAVVIIGFNVRPEIRAAEVAKSEDVDIRLHSIIYKVEEEIKAAMIGMLDAVEKETILGKAEVQEVFKITKVGTIAGCRVLDGVIRRQAKARLIRDGVVAWHGDLASLKRFKEDTNEVRQGYECGIGLANFNDIKVGDQIEAYVIEKIAPTEL
jgi:translation initiation factor IF-2